MNQTVRVPFIRWVAVFTVLTFSVSYSIASDDDPKPDVPILDLNSLALQMLDSEALYTVSGGVKPVSEGFWRTRILKSEGTSEVLVEMRKMLRQLPLGENFETGVLVFSNIPGDHSSASAFVAHRLSLEKLMARRRDVFEELQVSASQSAQEIMQAAERAKGGLRWKAFGLLFGYPDHAVDFFVQAGEKQHLTGEFQKRDFFQIPTYASDEGRFVYAVPQGYQPIDLDLRLRMNAISILDRYKSQRQINVNCSSLSGTVLLHDWVYQQRWLEKHIENGKDRPSPLLAVHCARFSDVNLNACCLQIDRHENRPHYHGWSFWSSVGRAR